MVKQATQADIGFLLDKAAEFHSTSVYQHVPFDVDTVVENLEQLIANGGVFYNDEGFVAGMLTPLVFNKNVCLAAELVWYCPDGNGAELKKAFEDWGRDSGAITSVFATLANDYAENLGNLLVEDGYRPLEVSYVKGLT